MDTREVDSKLRRLGQFLDRHQLDGVWLQTRGNFAWITCGRDNHIPNNTPVGVAAIFATRDSRLCLANTIEAPRMQNEELVDSGIDVLSFPWYDAMAARNAVREVIGSRRVAADVDPLGLGLAALPDDFAELRWSLTEQEIARYRQGAALAARAMEDICNDISPGDSEFDIAGALDDYIHRTGSNPVVTLVATDERIFQFRHPIPTAKKLQRYAMLVTCAEYGGLISNVTRFVYFGTLSDDLRAKQQAVCNVDAAINLATRPGRTLSELFRVLQQAYADNGFADQWQLHHQGGPTGYAPREAIADPTSLLTVQENQAFAWNPSIAGTKSEDTVLVTAGGVEVLTAHSKDWPTVEGRYGEGTLPRADILVR